MRPVISVTTKRSEKPINKDEKKSIRLMMEKKNSADTVSVYIIPKEAGGPTFSKVPDTKNIDETDEEAKHDGVTSLVLRLIGGVCPRSGPASANELGTRIRCHPKK
jgi:hypothetical protein